MSARVQASLKPHLHALEPAKAKELAKKMYHTIVQMEDKVRLRAAARLLEHLCLKGCMLCAVSASRDQARLCFCA